MPLQKKSFYEATPGEIYRGINSMGETFEGETKNVVEKDPDYVIYCKKMNKQFPGISKGAIFPEKYKEAVEFLGWHLNAEEHMAAVKGTFIVGLIPVVILLIIVGFVGYRIDLGLVPIGLGLIVDTPMFADSALMVFFVIAIVLFAIVAAVAYMIYNYPIGVGEDERTRALTYVPEMVGYLIMSMKLVPNLEKSIEFSAKHGRGKVADDFKRLIWDFQIGVYSSISEGLDAMAIRWGKYSVELKEALMKIRASVMEPSESKRYQILDKTMMEVLDSVKDKMGDYARSLNQPSVMLFYIGVLLPLLLVIILPVGSAFSNLPFATTPVLVFIYVFMIPFLAYSFAKGVVKKRPPTYEPPQINDNFAGLPRKGTMKFRGGVMDVRVFCILIIVVGVVSSLFLSMEGFPPKLLFPKEEDGTIVDGFQIIPADKSLADVFKERGVDYYGKVWIDLYVIQIFDSKNKGSYYDDLIKQGYDPKTADDMVFSEKLKIISKPSNDPTKYLFISGVLFSLVLAGCLFIYYSSIYKREAQLQIMQMEDEFKESMYMIASRMGENKPVENALKQAKDFLPNLLISKRIFGKTIENIELMGMPLENAVFDPMYGSMKGVPSKLLTTAMRLLVDSVSLGVEVAARTLMSLSLQMENMDKVNKSLKEMVSDVTTTMQTMALFIAPMVLGITTALQKVVVMTLSSVVASPSMDPSAAPDVGSIAGGAASGLQMDLFKVSIQSFKTFATPAEYLLIIGIYVILVVVILTYFTTKVREDNELLFRLNLAKSLPIAVAIYLITTIAANMAIGAVM
ncbi:MAG: hypothetical protein WCW13_02470 [archaeon]